MSTNKSTGRVGGHVRVAGYVPSAEAVERVAQAMQECVRDSGGGLPWEELGRFAHGAYRSRATAALSAAVPVEVAREVARLLGEVRALADRIIGESPDTRTDAWHGRVEVADQLRAVLDTVGVPAQVDEAAPVRVRMLHGSPNHVEGQIGTLRDASPSGHVNECVKWIDYGEPIQWSHGQSESTGEWCGPGEYEVVVDEAATGGEQS